MDKEKIFEKVKKIIAGSSEFYTEEDGVELESKIDWLGLSTLEVMDVFIKTEYEFSINISDDEIDNCITVQDIVDLVASK